MSVIRLFLLALLLLAFIIAIYFSETVFAIFTDTEPLFSNVYLNILSAFIIGVVLFVLIYNHRKNRKIVIPVVIIAAILAVICTTVFFGLALSLRGI